MKILIVIANPLGWLDPGSFGGGEINTVTHNESWEKHGINVETIEPLNYSISKARKMKYKTHYIKLFPKKNNLFTSMIITPIWSLKALIKSKNLKFDLIYSSTSNITDALPSYIISQIHKKPLMCSVRASVYDNDMISIFKRLREEGSTFSSSFVRGIGVKITLWILKRCEIILTPCELIKETLVNLGIEKEKIFVLDHGIKTDEIIDHEEHKKVYDLCFFSRIEKNKGINDFIYICKKLNEKNKGLKTVIVGTGSKIDFVKKYVNENNLEGNILITGFLLGNEKYSYIKKSKVVVYPTYAREAWGTIVPETLCCGTYLISYDNPITKNVFGHLSSISFVKTGDKDELKTTVERFLADYEKNHIKINNQCIIDGSLYDINQFAKEEINIIKRVLKCN